MPLLILRFAGLGDRLLAVLIAAAAAALLGIILILTFAPLAIRIPLRRIRLRIPLRLTYQFFRRLGRDTVRTVTLRFTVTRRLLLTRRRAPIRFLALIFVFANTPRSTIP